MYHFFQRKPETESATCEGSASTLENASISVAGSYNPSSLSNHPATPVTDACESSIDSATTSSGNAKEGGGKNLVSSLPDGSASALSSFFPNDIGNFIGQSISDYQKRELLLNPWKPPADYSFPFSTYICNGKEYKRYLSHKHLDHYKNWLVLSHSSRGLYCKFCPLFNVGCVGGKDKNVPLKKLVTEPLTIFKDLLGSSKNSCLANHEKNNYHKTAVEKGKYFLDRFDKPEIDVVNQVSQQRLSKVLENRERLVPIIRATLFLGRQGLAFRGHRDDGPLFEHQENSESTAGNEGNFRETLKLMVQSGDKKLEEHLKSTSSRATYISKTTQNELIDCIGEVLLEKIVERVKQADFFSVIFDETTDLSHKSQLSMILRYVYENAIYEDFVSFIDAFEEVDKANAEEGIEEGEDGREMKMTGKVIGKIVLRLLRKLGLPLNKCVGIGTDGCSVMTSNVRGAVMEIQKKATNALRTPCFNHKLNLSIAQSNKITWIRNAVGTMKECVAFFDASAKRCRILKKFLGHNLSGLCETRWIERHEGVLQFSVDLPKILEALESISSWDDISTSSKASQLRAAMMDSFFLVSIICLSDILALTLPLSKLFQKPDLNIYVAAETVTNLISLLSARREKADECFTEIWEKIKELAESVDGHLIPPRRCGRQTNRANYVAETPEAYFRQALYIPLLDHIVVDLKDRFPQDVLDCFNLPLLLPVNVVKITVLEEAVEILVQRFGALLPCKGESAVTKKLLHGEISMWREKWRNKSNTYPKSPEDLLKICDKDMYPLVNALLNVLISLPISNASAERSFSGLRRLKTWLRTTMSQNRLTGLALMCVHRGEEVAIDNVITRFAKSKKRREDFIL